MRDIVRAKHKEAIQFAITEIDKSIHELFTPEYWLGRKDRLIEFISESIITTLESNSFQIHVESPLDYYDASGH